MFGEQPELVTKELLTAGQAGEGVTLTSKVSNEFFHQYLLFTFV